MGLIDQIKRDIASITTNYGDFAISLLFTNLLGESVSVYGNVKKHHLGFDQFGVPVNVKTASCSVSESTLIKAGYVVRNMNGEVAMTGHRVKWTDSSGRLCEFFIRENYPDETIGLIVFLLSDFQ